MKKLKCLVFFLISVIIISTPVLAKGQNISINHNENKINLAVPSGYVYFTLDDVDKDASYFKNMPIDKNEAINQIREGTCLNAISEEQGSQIVLKITSDEFTKKVGNFTPMDDNDKEKVIKNFRDIYENRGHSFLAEPKIVEIDNYSFIEFNCRYGSGEKGFSYQSILTIIAGESYELVRYTTLSVPDETDYDEFETLKSSLDLKIKGEKTQLTKNFFMTAICVIIMIIAIIVILLMIYSLVREYIVHKNHNEKVRVKKR